LEAFGAGLLSAGYRDAISFIVLFIVLAVRLGGWWRRSAVATEQAGL
jgi:hypothetical protein